MKYKNVSLAQLFRQITPNLFSTPHGTASWGDLNGALAGLIAAIPQVLAFGLIIGNALGGALSGVGVLIALYGSALLGLTAAIFGGNPFLVVGPRASTLLVFAALIVQLSHSAALSHLPHPAPIALALACTAVLCSGLLQVFFGAFRLGQLINYVPFPVMSGFINGSALLIILSQLWPATGITEQPSLWDFFSHLNEAKPATLLLALATTALVMLAPRLSKRIPPLPLAFIAGTVAYHILASFGFADALGGTIPPPPEHYSLHVIAGNAFAILFSPAGLELMLPILAAALSMSILSSLDTLFAIAATDEMTMRRSNTGRQLMAEGAGNILAGILGLAPGSSSLARTRAAFKGGMKSVATPIGMALLVLIVALALGSEIGMLSQAVMAGLLISLGIDLIDKWTLTRLSSLFSRSSGSTSARSDMIVVAVVVATALIANLTAAVGIGILLSILLFVTQMARNPIRRCYRATTLIPHIYGDLARQRSIEHYGESIAIIEIEGALFFGTVSELESRIEALSNDGVIHIVLDMRRVKHIDATGARALERINTRLSPLGGMLAVGYVDHERRNIRERRNIKARLNGEDRRRQSISRNIWAKLADFGTVAAMGKERFLSDTDTAIALCEKHLSATAGSAMQYELAAVYSPLMRSLNRHMMRRLRGHLTRASYQPGDIVFSQGSAPDGAFFVASGRVEVMIDLPGTERKRKVQSLTSGSVFGEMALIDPNPRSASIIVAEPTTCYHMSSANFDHLKVTQADIAFTLLSAVATIFAERLRATNTMLAEMEA